MGDGATQTHGNIGIRWPVNNIGIIAQGDGGDLLLRCVMAFAMVRLGPRNGSASPTLGRACVLVGWRFQHRRR